MNCCLRTFETEAWVKGCTAIVTGSNCGLGKETARQLLKKGVHVVMACRNPERANSALEELKKDINENNGSMDALQLDLSSFKSVRSFVETFKKKYNSLDILVNNAGLDRSTKMTEDGNSEVFQVNYMSHFLLTHLLLPLLMKSKSARIINLSSVMHRYGKGEYITACNGNHEHIYSESKLAMALFSFELQRRLRLKGNNNIKVVAVNPGAVGSNIWRNWSIIYKAVIKCMFLTPQQGCISSVYAATSDEINGGEYISVYMSLVPGVEMIERLSDSYGIYCGYSKMNPSSLCTNKLENELWDWTLKKLEITSDL